MEHLSKAEVESLKVGDVICILDIEQSRLKDSDDRNTVMEIINRPDGSVKLRLSCNGIMYLHGKDRQPIRDKHTGEYKSKPHVWKSTLSSSRMTKPGKIHSHASGMNYTQIVVKAS